MRPQIKTNSCSFPLYNNEGIKSRGFFSLVPLSDPLLCFVLFCCKAREIISLQSQRCSFSLPDWTGQNKSKLFVYFRVTPSFRPCHQTSTPGRRRERRCAKYLQGSRTPACWFAERNIRVYGFGVFEASLFALTTTVCVYTYMYVHTHTHCVVLFWGSTKNNAQRW